MNKFLSTISCLLLLSYFLPRLQAQEKRLPDKILAELKYSLEKELLDVYYPRNIDSLHGGYLSNFSFDFKQAEKQEKMIVTQARHLWTTSKSSKLYPAKNYLDMARHGYIFLRDKMWDKEYGGFITLVDRQGRMISERKEAYGNAFGIYGLAAYFEASGDSSALALAIDAFRWLEKHSHDPRYGGYFQHLQRNGTPIARPVGQPKGSDLGYKDQNSSIHLLEAFTSLYQVWPDPLLKKRLAEMLSLIRDRIVQPKGYLQLFFTLDWKPVSLKQEKRDTIIRYRTIDHVSFGHDVETAYLMKEAAELLGEPVDTKSVTLLKGKLMLDHALDNGWDKQRGGFYDQGYYFGNADTISILKHSKNWWAQAEGLNTFLVFSQLYPTDKHDYSGKFVLMWNYIKEFLLDHEHGDWYEEGLDNEPQRKSSAKSHIWKATYHNFRSLDNCIRIIEGQHKH